MIKRRLTTVQLETLALIHSKTSGGAVVLTLKQRGDLSAPLSVLRREKLVTCDQIGSYALTEAGAEALSTGLYEKQPHTLNMPESAKIPAAKIPMTYMGPGSKRK